MEELKSRQKVKYCYPKDKKKPLRSLIPYELPTLSAARRGLPCRVVPYIIHTDLVHVWSILFYYFVTGNILSCINGVLCAFVYHIWMDKIPSAAWYPVDINKDFTQQRMQLVWPNNKIKSTKILNPSRTYIYLILNANKSGLTCFGQINTATCYINFCVTEK